MESGSNTVLVSGGAAGIGLALAERFLQAGSTVIICGRRGHKWEEARERWPQIQTRACDLAQATERTALYEWAVAEFPRLSVRTNGFALKMAFGPGRYLVSRRRIKPIKSSSPQPFCSPSS